jgi:acyl-CoA synthetase (AMP-forming)/AMP-acid ligase II
MQPELRRWVREAFAPAPLFVMYGQTEATARLSFLPPENAADKDGSIGRGLENVELRVVDPGGRELPTGEVGEVVARGPSITSGYFGAPEESAQIIRGGWLWTGDLGWRDEEGFIFLVGRAKDMLKLGGHRVAAAEIENVLLEHPGVREAAVVGAPDATGGEAAVAFAVSDSAPPPSADDLRRHCRQRLAAFKVPKEIRFIDQLPRTSSGKIAKAELRERLNREDSFLEGRVEAGSGSKGG